MECDKNVSDLILNRPSFVFHPSLSFCGFTKLNLNWSVLFFYDIKKRRQQQLQQQFVSKLYLKI